MIRIKEVDSTNNFLKDLLSNSTPVPEGTVIMAEDQYAGRGQQLNRWHSQPGKNLTFSLLLKPTFVSLQYQFDLTRVISLGIIKALEPILATGLKIKWPNDIYYNDKKLGGVLIENIIQGGQIKNAIVGMGLNINQESFPEFVPNPVSVKQITRTDHDLNTILSAVCNNIEIYYTNLKAGKFDFIRKSYFNRLYWLNEGHQFKANGTVFNGTITGVTDNGMLLINDGTEQMKFSLKEIEFLNK